MTLRPAALWAAMFTLSTLLATPRIGEAHFPWFGVNADNHAVLFFSEGIGERDYHVPESVEKAEVTLASRGESRPLAMRLVEEEGFSGMVSAGSIPDDAALSASILYGVYHGMKLSYEARRAPLGDGSPSVLPAPKALLGAAAARTDDGLRLLVTWEGKPLGSAEATLTDSTGATSTSTTNEQGLADFPAPAEGEVGLLVGHTLNDASGEHEGEEYTSAAYYLTLTTVYSNRPAVAEQPPQYPDLPAAVASFGAAASDGWVYVYGGHIGEEHHHSVENLSSHFCRLKLDGGEAWEELPMQTTLQGLALVAHGGKLYRVGGVHSRNAADEPEDMHSTDEFASYNPATGAWTTLAPLPAPRSSHDAVVVGDYLYVVGGWTLKGKSPGEWRREALRFDFNAPAKGWQQVAQPPVARRALALAHLDGKLVALGGMLEDQEVTSRVDAYDPASDSWSELPPLPSEGLSGFGLAACHLGGTLYACGMQGEVLALGGDADAWKPVAKLSDPRFFHRLLPAGPQTLVVVAGASTEHGHVGAVDEVRVDSAPN